MGFEKVIFLTVAALSGQGRKVESLAIVTEPGFEKSKVSVWISQQCQSFTEKSALLQA